MEKPKTKDRQGIQSIEVGGKLLQALAANGRAMMLRDLAKAAGMPAANHDHIKLAGIGIGKISHS